MSTSFDEALREGFKRLARPALFTVDAVVLEVDRDALTVDVRPVDGRADILDVRLRAVSDGGVGGMVVVPVVGSLVLVAAVSNNWNNAYVAQASDVQLFTLKTVEDSLKKWCYDVLAAVKLLTVTTAAGESKPPTNAASFTQLQQRLDKLFLE